MKDQENNVEEEKKLHDVLKWILGTLRKEDAKLLEKLLGDGLVKADVKSPENFNLDYNFPFSRFVYSLVEYYADKKGVSEENLGMLLFIYQNYDFVDNYFSTFVQRFEGMPCSADKVRFCINSIVEYLATGDQPDIEEIRLEYRVPGICFSNFWEVITFMEALKELYYWDILPYGKILPKLIEGVPERRADNTIMFLNKYASIGLFFDVVEREKIWVDKESVMKGDPEKFLKDSLLSWVIDFSEVNKFINKHVQEKSSENK